MSEIWADLGFVNTEAVYAEDRQRLAAQEKADWAEAHRLQRGKLFTSCCMALQWIQSLCKYTGPASEG